MHIWVTTQKDSSPYEIHTSCSGFLTYRVPILPTDGVDGNTDDKNPGYQIEKLLESPPYIFLTEDLDARGTQIEHYR